MRRRGSIAHEERRRERRRQWRETAHGIERAVTPMGGGTGKGSTKGGDAARHEGRGGEKVNLGYGFLRIGGFDGFGTNSSRPSK